MAGGTMKTTYYLVTAAALAVAALTVYAQLPSLNGPLPPNTTASAAPSDVPRLALPPVTTPPDEPLVMPGAAVKPAELPPLPAAAPAKPSELPPLPGATPVGFSEPAVPVPPALPPVPTTPAVPPVAPEVSVPLPAVPATPSAPAVPPVPPAPVAPPAGLEPPVLPPPAVPAPKPTPTDVPPAPPVKPNAPVEPLVPPPAMPVTPPKPTPAPTPVPTPVLQPPVQPTPAPLAPSVTTPAPQVTGETLPGTKYIVLKDDKVIEGSVTLRGDVVVVRQGALDRPYSKGQVQYVADSKDEVYKFQLAKVSSTDAAGRLKVARWCMFSGMREQALTEAREVQKLQPANTDAAALVRSLEQSLKQFPPAGAPVMTAPAAPVFPTELSSPKPVAEAVPDVPADAANLFGTKVQPILANQCVDCHAKADHAGKFKLVRVDPAGAGRAQTNANLAAVMGQIRKDDLEASPLLVASVTAHGGQKLPSFTRQAVAYRTLEAWVSLAAGAPATIPPAATLPAAPAKPALPPVATPTVEAPVLPPVANPALPAVPTTPAIPAAPALPPVGAPTADPVLPPVPVTPAPAVPVPPMIPSADPLLPPVPVVPKPEAPALPPIPPASAAPAVPLPALPPSGFGSAAPPKPPATGPAGDEFDPAGFNQGMPKK